MTVGDKNPLDDLLSAIDKLADGYTDAHWLRDEGTGRRAIVRFKRDGLLRQLRHAIIGGIGSHGGTSLASERLPFDVGALELYESIEAAISDLYVSATGKPVYLKVETTLRQWFIAIQAQVQAREINDCALRDAVRRVDAWVRVIEGKFNPPKTLELTVNEFVPVRNPDGGLVRDDLGEVVWEIERDRRGCTILDGTGHPKRKSKRHLARCPVCDADTAWDRRTGDQMPALILEYRDESQMTIKHAHGLCRACETVWRGGLGIRELSFAIQQQENDLNTPTAS